MEQPLTPPPSFRVLRVRTRVRTRTISDENKCGHLAQVRSSEGLACPRKDASPARGRTRSRVVRNGLTLNTNCIHPNFPLGLPTCCSPPSSRGDITSASCDDDLIFQMSPIQTQSPSLTCFDDVHRVHADANRVKQSTVQTLSALWEKHKASLTATASQPLHSPRTPNKRMRADTITQHQRGFSDTHANIFPLRERSSGHRSQQSGKAVFDLSPILHAPLDRSSPPPEEPFLYSFPSFDSSPLVKAREARARRHAAKGSAAREEYLTGSVESDGEVDPSVNVKIEHPAPQRFGPIRARKLRIQSGESLSEVVDSTNIISHAFKSASLDPEKDIDLDDAFDTGYFSSQRSSSVSTLSSTDEASLARSHFLSSSLLASFPVQPSSCSRTKSSSKSQERTRRTDPSEISPEAKASAMMTRGRASRRASAEVQQNRAEYSGGDRRGRGRTPPRGRPPANDARTTTTSAHTKTAPTRSR